MLGFVDESVIAFCLGVILKRLYKIGNEKREILTQK